MKILEKIIKNKKITWQFSFFFAIVLVAFLFVAKPAAATWATSLIGFLAQGIYQAVGWILMKVIGILVKIAQYNNFINEGPVVNGWVIVRDVANMFFVVILLVIAFATILRIERYNYKKWLPKLLMMAVLINFSKTICGLLIDAAQIIMLTFVGAFSQVGEGNLVDLLGITGWQELSEDLTGANEWRVAAALVLSAIYVIVSLIVILAMVAMLVMRMVMIWVYVVLSPLAFLLSSFPDGQKYASQWWSEFTKNLIIGPILAFFIWLSFTSVVSYENISSMTPVNVGDKETLASVQAEEQSQALMLKFIIGISMLIGGMKIAQEIGGAAGGMAGKVFNKGKGLALMGAGAVGGYALAKAKMGAKSAVMAVGNTKAVRTGLDKLGSARGGFWGNAARFTGVRNLARNSSIALGNYKEAVESKAKKKVDALKRSGASRTVASIAEGKAFFMSQKAAQKEAKKILPVPQEKFDKTLGVDGLSNPLDKQELINNMNSLDWKKEPASFNQIMQAGKAGIDLDKVPAMKEYLEHNMVALGRYNSGVTAAGRTDYLIGKDNKGEELTNPATKFGKIISDPDEINKSLGITGPNKYAFRVAEKSDKQITDRKIELQEKIKYHQEKINNSKKGFAKDNKKTIQFHQGKIADLEKHYKPGNTEQIKYHKEQLRKARDTKTAYNNYKEDDEEIIKHRKEITEAQSEFKSLNNADKKGTGNLSVNGFAREGSAIGVDFSKLDSKTQAEMLKAAKSDGASTLNDVKGVHVTNSDGVKDIAKSLVDIINKEIQGIKSKGSKMTVADERRLDYLNQSKSKLKKSKDLSSLSLINSSASGYDNYSDSKETIVHEKVHKLGAYNESLADNITDEIMSSPANLKVLDGGSDFLKILVDKMNVVNGNKGSKNEINEIISREKDAIPPGYNFLTKSENGIKSDALSSSGGDNITNITNVNNAGNGALNVKSLSNKLKEMYSSKAGGSLGNDSFLAFYFKNFIRSLNKVSANFTKLGGNERNAKNRGDSDLSIKIDNQDSQGGVANKQSPKNN